MKLKFDPNQEFQLTAINSVIDLFDGQPPGQDEFEITMLTGGDEDLFSGVVQTDWGTGNNLLLDDDALLSNVHKIQDKNDLERTPSLKGYVAKDENIENFSVEMETGTGKTYVYIRTIFELSRKYGFKKFIIVVPSVAIREGVLKNLQITQDHFKALYNNIEYEYYVYDGKKVNKLRYFATSNQIQILIINIDAFRKNFTGTEDEIKGNVIYRANDKLSGRPPIEFINATNPIVIIDEPQSVDNTDKAKEAIKALNPLCTLRYSATHINPYSLLYKLDPIMAYEMKLVKQIVVASVMGDDAFNAAYARLIEVDIKNGIRAKIVFHQNTADGVKEKKQWVKAGTDLFTISKEREAYRDGCVIAEISAELGNEYIEFNSGNRLNLGQEQGGIKDDLMRVQIRNTIKTHLEKELKMKDKGIKVLSLFFIDKVANYRSYNEEGNPVKGKFADWFEEFFNELIKSDRYKGLLDFPIEKLHDGYFAQDKKGVLKDTGGNTQADEDVYNKIMKNKEQLLSVDEPLRFIFSHSALREGWDNPNVFQICTLNETKSTLKKRQEIGRGLRLPVNSNGERVFDESINKLLVVANESYEDFARTLQNEYENDCGVTFGKVPSHAFTKLPRIVDGEEASIGREESEKIWDKLKESEIIDDEGRIQKKFDPKKPGFDLGLGSDFEDVKTNIIDVLESYQLDRHIKKHEDERKLVVKKQVLLSDDFKELWDRIKAKTTYSVEYSTAELIVNAVKLIEQMDEIKPVKVAYNVAKIEILKKGLDTTLERTRKTDISFVGSLPDIIAHLQKETELTRHTIATILLKSKRLGEFIINPQKFMDAVSSILKRVLHKLMIDGIKYEKISGQYYNMTLFENKEILSYLNNRLEVKKSVYDAIVYDSEIERKFAEDLENRDDIKLFVKLPRWFTVETPIGEYNPDWAILKHDETVLYLVRETKGTKDFMKLRTSEAEKVRCGRQHFKELDVSFEVVKSADEV